MSAATLPNDDWAALRDEPCTGPRTGDQFAALREFGELAERQGEAFTAEFPPYLGPVTGEIEAAGKPRRARRFRLWRGWPLAAVLAVQAVLSLRLVWADTAFMDEAGYIWAGHLEWAHWLRGTPIPQFPTYFSGAPVVYPPLAALADSAGGLAAARMLSLLFMLGATSLLWSAADRRFGRRAAFFGAGMFALGAPTLHLGSFATYDAMALFFTMLAAWLVLAAPGRGDAVRWILCAAGALAVANSAKYASALFDPVVIALAVLACPAALGRKGALRRGALLTGSVAALIIGLLELGGSWYTAGIAQTTTDRQGGTDSMTAVLALSWHWISVIAALSVIAMIVSLLDRGDRSARLCVLLLAGAAFLVPLQQARIHTTTSLVKHVDFGMWFAAIAIGYAGARVTGLMRDRRVRVPAAAAGFLAVLAGWGALGYGQSMYLATQWPDSAGLIAALRPMTDHGGRILAEEVSVPQYYLPGVPWQRWSSTYTLTAASVASKDESGSAGPYIQALKAHYFSVVVLDFRDTFVLDKQIARFLRSDKSYRVAAVVRFSNGNYVIWRYEPAARGYAR